MIPIEAQFFALVAMVLFGIFMGIAFDIYRELKITFQLNPITTNIWDFIVWLIFIFLAYIVLLYTNYGEVRLYIFMGIAVGLLVYFRFFSRMARKPIRIILFLLLKTVSFLFSVVKVPITILQKILVFPANILSLAFFKIIFPIKKLFALVALPFSGKKKK